MQLSAAESPVQGQEAMREAAVIHAQEMGEVPEPGLEPEEYEVQRPIVKSAEEKLGRNDPCWCGSGKKYKHCHGG